MQPYLKWQNILYCHQTRDDLTPRRLLNIFWELRLITRPTNPTNPTTQQWTNYQHTETVIDIYTDGAIDMEPQTTRRKGIGIHYGESAQPISANAHTARDSTQTELQAICLAITTSPPYQHIHIHTDSSRAIRTIQKEASTAKQHVRRAYSTELRSIQNSIHKKNLQIEWIKVKAHGNNQSNNLADQLAKAGKTSNNTFEIETDNPTIVNATGTPIGQDPHHWIKKREQVTTILK